MATSQSPAKSQEHPDEAEQLPATRLSPKSKAAADAKIIAALRHDLEASRGRLTIVRRKELATKLLEHSHGDDTFFTRLSKRMQHAGVNVPSVTVEYRNLRVDTEALVGAASVATVASVPLGIIKRLLCLHRGRESRPLRILNDVQGKLVPGRLTLLLGPPACGKSTFMRSLTSRMIPAQGKVSGDIRYNGYKLDEFNILRSSAYVDQIDNHNPNLTVRETLDFAHACQVGLHGAAFNLPAELAAHHITSSRQSQPTAGGGNGQNGDSTNGGGAGVKPGNGNANGNANGNDHSHLGSSSNACGLKALRHSHNERPLLEQAVPDDEFEALLRQAWGTQVKVDIVMALLGLTHCAETVVGDQIVRGISGGERKRLTAAEMLVGPSSVVMMDEMSTGLDSATLFTVVRWLSQAAKALQMTIMASLLQPPPEVFGLFDDVILLTEGRVLYHGPVKDVVDHFRTLGLDCPDRKDVPSFLLEITTPTGQREFAGSELRARFNLPPLTQEDGGPVAASRTGSSALPPPGGGGAADATAGWLAAANASTVSGGGGGDASSRGNSRFLKLRPKSMLVSVEEMEQAFWTQNPHGVKMASELRDQPLQPLGPDPPPPLVPKGNRFALMPVEAVATATRRQLTLVMRDKVLLKGRLMQVIVLGLLTGSLFYNQGVSLIASRTMFGACFMSTLFMSFGGFPQLPVTMELKKVWFKHRAAGFYPAYAQGMAMALSQLPLSILESVIFSLIMYFLVNFYRQPGYFFTFMVIMASCSMSVSSLFRYMACICPNMVVANAAVGFVFVVLILTSGFAIVHKSIPPWTIWAYWISPQAYALRALVVNEMVSPKWQNVPAPPGMPAGLSLGDAALMSFDFYRERKWIWIGVGFLIGSFIVLTYTSIISLAFQQPEVPAAQLPDPEEIQKARRRAEERHSKLVQEEAATAAAEAAVIEVRPPSGGAQPLKTLSQEGAGKKQSREDGASVGLEPSGMVSSPSLAALQDFNEISSSLPFTPITLVFQDLKYWVPNPTYSRAAAKAAAKAAAEANQAGIDAHARAATGKTDIEMASGQQPAAASGGGGGGIAAGGDGGVPLAARERLQLLSGITGYNEPGVLLALMGGSGAGKTTLMDVIAGRKTIGEIGGTITVNGHQADPRAWSRVMGYVEQFDIHSPGQTVQEALQFSARLRLPRSLSDLQVKSYVEEVLEIVDLLPLLGALVGSPGASGLSVEARKRLTIAVELVANPSCIFLDEPTSGLDARAAAIVMRAVRNVACNGRTVMVTIHQPSIEIFESFDNLLLIQRGGLTTYFGPLGSQSADLISYFRAVPGTPALPSGFNPATWMLEVTGGSMATVLDRVDVDWPAHYAASELAAKNNARAGELVDRGFKTARALEVGTRYAMPFRSQVKVLLRKFNLAYWRSPGYNFMRLGMTLVTSFIYAAVYWGEGVVPNPASIANVQNVMGIMFASSNFLGMINLMSVMPVVGYERVVFYRERAASMYNPFAYGAAIALVEMPYLLAQALTFVPIIYFMIGFDPLPEQFFYYIIVFFETIALYTIFGQTLVYVTPAQTIAQVVGAGFNFLFNVFNGFIITYPDMPSGWRWMNRIVPPTWILYGLGISQLGNDEGELIYGGKSTPVNEFMKERFGYRYDMRWWVVLILLAYVLVLRVGSILALKYWNFLRR
ncbi:hypothetical protein VaNZ11_015971 [Volvox africanus]|uniref:ABC transporter domain-containing protein n=1 Tax=Volvox africanus TaxID=51714 RepID=A0ABQ5SM34_9CHLO|nr:hypothetical protein VaNZ11_015971 [Volvox africanus]